MGMAELICPVCRSNNTSGATVCAYCGTALEPGQGSDGLATVQVGDIKPIPVAGKLPPPKTGIAFYEAETLEGIVVQDDLPFVLGRMVIEESDVRVVDLQRFGAYESGVSQKHAMVQKTADGYDLTDLASSNGTRLDGQVLRVYQPYPLKNGSRLILGRLQLVVAFQEPTGRQE